MFDLIRENKRTERGAERRFFSGVLLLSLSTVVVKLLGLGFKIPMLSLLGAEGMGYFNSAYEIFAVLCTLATAGLPIALSILVASKRASGELEAANGIYRSARRIFAFFGISVSLLMILLSEQLAELIGNPNARLCICAIAPALAFSCLSGAIRGYCQGFEYMSPTAISQLIEAVGKLVFGILFALLAIRRGYGLPEVSAFAVLGISVGSLLALIYLAIAKRTKSFFAFAEDGGKNDSNAEWNGTKNSNLVKLLKIAFPITLGSLVIGLTRIIDMTLIMRRLADVGIDASERNEIYGAYTTLSLPIFSLIPALISPIAVALVPQLSAFAHRKDRRGEMTVTENSIRLTVILSLPASLGLTAFARPILELLFSGQHEAIAMAAPLLSALGGSVLFSCLMTTTNAILQAYGKANLPIVSMSIGVAVKLASSWMLMGIEGIGVMGAPIGSLICNITVTLINLAFVFSCSGGGLSAMRLFFKPIAASAVSVGGALALYIYLNRAQGASTLTFALALICAVLLYLAFSLAMGSITVEDISLLPFFSRFFKRKRRKGKEES